MRPARKIGMKPAGGISTAKTSIQYLIVLRETLGQDWLTRIFSESAPRAWPTTS
jgi:deoxyribose-phosphate aldolase